MPPFVLVHGTGHGGWCWRPVARALRAKGFDVHAPTLTGVSDRAHLLGCGVDLTTHVTDVRGWWRSLAREVGEASSLPRAMDHQRDLDRRPLVLVEV